MPRERPPAQLGHAAIMGSSRLLKKAARATRSDVIHSFEVVEE
jgi:hypothetical protein